MNSDASSVLTTGRGIQFHPRFEARALESGEVVLLSEQDTHVLSGSEYAAMHPLLDGSRNPDTLVECLAERFPRERIYYALVRLEVRGLLDVKTLPDPDGKKPHEAPTSTLTKVPTPPHIHVYKMIVRQPLESRLATGVLLQPVTVSGWGITDEQARTRCLGEAEERRAMFSAPSSSLCRARMDDLEGRAIAPHELELLSTSQRGDQEHSHAVGRLPPAPTKLHDPVTTIDWIGAWSWSQQEPVWLPAAHCFFAHAHCPKGPHYRADSSGCAAADNLNDAILHGYFELVERDACAIWWFNRLRRPTIDIAVLPDPFLLTSVNAMQDLGRTLKVFDLTHDLGVPVNAAVSWRIADGTGLKLGLGAHVDHACAIRQSVGELNQLVYGDMEDSADISVPEHIYMPALDSDPDSRLATDFNLKGDSTAVLESCVETLGTRGLELIVLDRTVEDASRSVVRVVVPGLRSLSAQLAPGRLYDVPLDMGWRQVKAGEDEFQTVATMPWWTS